MHNLEFDLPTTGYYQLYAYWYVDTEGWWHLVPRGSCLYSDVSLCVYFMVYLEYTTLERYFKPRLQISDFEKNLGLISRLKWRRFRTLIANWAVKSRISNKISGFNLGWDGDLKPWYISILVHGDPLQFTGDVSTENPLYERSLSNLIVLLICYWM